MKIDGDSIKVENMGLEQEEDDYLKNKSAPVKAPVALAQAKWRSKPKS